ncbi:MAG: MYXO-CTERM sorting domain-containing protein, partial [Sorangiineae bacterium]|nr:MYXO-CTERM sorting domain-containing protein [Sorangiineae bacterium]
GSGGASAGSGGASAGSGGASAGSGGANAGSGGATAASADDGGCGCRVAPARTSATAALAALLGGLLLGARRRVRSGRGVPRRTDLPS